MPSALVWNSIPNVDATNNSILIVGPDTNDDAAIFNISFPQGLYDLDSITETLEDQLSNLGAKQVLIGTKTLPLVSFEPNYSTNKVEMVINHDTVIVNFSGTNSIAPLLGFDSIGYGPYTTGIPTTISAPQVAALNTIDGIQIHTNLVSEGLLIGNQYSQVIGAYALTVGAGYQDFYQPFLPPVVQEDYLAGRNIKHLVFYITDSNGNDLIMTEVWSANIRIEWD
jgi:hypothetical protein